MNWLVISSSDNIKQTIQTIPHDVASGIKRNRNLGYISGLIKSSYSGASIIAEHFDDSVIYCLKIEGGFWVVHVHNGLISSKSDSFVKGTDLNYSVKSFINMFSDARVVCGGEYSEISVDKDIVEFELIYNNASLSKSRIISLKSTNNIVSLLFFIGSIIFVLGLFYFVYVNYIKKPNVIEDVSQIDDSQIRLLTKQNIDKAIKNSYKEHFNTVSPVLFFSDCIKRIGELEPIVYGWKMDSIKCNTKNLYVDFKIVHRINSNYKNVSKVYEKAIFNVDGTSLKVNIDSTNNLIHRDYAGVKLENYNSFFTNFLFKLQNISNQIKGFKYNVSKLKFINSFYINPAIKDKSKARTPVPEKYLFRYYTIKITSNNALDFKFFDFDKSNISIIKDIVFKVSDEYVISFEMNLNYYVK